MMKRALALILVSIILIGPGNGLAQGPELTETYSDELITFRYPAGWLITPDDTDQLLLTNRPPEDTSALAPEVGIVKMTIDPYDLADTGDVGITLEDFEADDRALFMVGFYSGAVSTGYQFIASLASAFSEESIEPTVTFSRFEVIEGGYLAEIIMRTGEEGVDLLVITTETYLIAVGTSANELDQWRDTVFAIVDTVTVNQ